MNEYIEIDRRIEDAIRDLAEGVCDFRTRDRVQEWLGVAERIELVNGAACDGVRQFGDELTVEDGDIMLELTLHNGVRLYAPLNAAPPPQATKPDWAAAPDWARYWAVDPSGEAFWFAELPQQYSGGGFAGWNSPNAQIRLDRTVLLPLGTDWRQTIAVRSAGMRT